GRGVARGHDPLNDAAELDTYLRVLELCGGGAGEHQEEDELGADVERAVRLDERAALRDVLGVVGEERVESLVVDSEGDGGAQVLTPLVATVRHRAEDTDRLPPCGRSSARRSR